MYMNVQQTVEEVTEEERAFAVEWKLEQDRANHFDWSYDMPPNELVIFGNKCDILEIDATDSQNSHKIFQ